MIKDTFRAALGRPSYHGEERSIAERWEPALCPTSHTWAQVVARWLETYLSTKKHCANQTNLGMVQRNVVGESTRKWDNKPCLPSLCLSPSNQPGPSSFHLL